MKQVISHPSAVNTPLPLPDAQAIAESIVGPVRWNGAEALCECPGKAQHTKTNAPTDCKIVCEPIGTLAPGVYCFHSSCEDATGAASYTLRRALWDRIKPVVGTRATTATTRRAVAPKPVFDPFKLERIALKLDGIDAEWLALRSPKRPDNRTPASFLLELYRPGESVVVFDRFHSQGQAIWTHHAPPFDARELDTFRTGKKRGVWFLANPVTGGYAATGEGKSSRRSWRTVTSWRYLVLESDEAKPEHWLAVLAQMQLPIAAIYTSGGKSIHALVRLDAESKAEWDAARARMMPFFVTLGADRKALSAVRLTRLPCCDRLGTDDTDGAYHAFDKPRLQRLLFLDPSPLPAPICEMPVIAPGWADRQPADQDGFNAGGNE